MRKFTVLDNVTMLEWCLTIQEGYLFEWLHTLPSWADKIIKDGEVYYFASKNKACDDLPMLSDKPDTMYRYYKKLSDKGLILIIKENSKDYISLTEKSKKWNAFISSDKNPSIIPEHENSDKNPTELGKSSESTRNNIRHIDNTIIDNNYSIKPDSSEVPTSEPPKKSKKVEKLSDDVVFPIVKKCSKHFPADILSRLSKNDKLNWSDTVEKLIRIDKYTEEDILNAVKYGRSGWWAKNFLSLTKLRKKDKQGVKYISIFLNQSGGTGTDSGDTNFVDEASDSSDLL